MSLAPHGSFGMAFRQIVDGVGAPEAVFSRSHSRPAGPPVNASTYPLGPPHDSGYEWFATPFSSGTLTPTSCRSPRRTTIDPNQPTRARKRAKTASRDQGPGPTMPKKRMLMI